MQGHARARGGPGEGRAGAGRAARARWAAGGTGQWAAAGSPTRREVRGPAHEPPGRVKPGCCCPGLLPFIPASPFPPFPLILTPSPFYSFLRSWISFLGGPSPFQGVPFVLRHARTFCTPTAPGLLHPRKPFPFEDHFSRAPSPLHPIFFPTPPPAPQLLRRSALARAWPHLTSALCSSALHSPARPGASR